MFCFSVIFCVIFADRFFFLGDSIHFDGAHFFIRWIGLKPPTDSDPFIFTRNAEGGVIAVNALLMGCETDIDWGGWLVFENFLLCSLAPETGWWFDDKYESMEGSESLTSMIITYHHLSLSYFDIICILIC